jgi:hypothetical protein
MVYRGILLALFAATAAFAQDGPMNASAIELRRLPAVVETAIDTELPGSAFVKVRLPFPGAAAHGTAICPYEAVGNSAPRIRLRCNRILPQGYQGLVVMGDFYEEDGLIGVPAYRAENGAHYTNRGGQAGYLYIHRLIAVER